MFLFKLVKWTRALRIFFGGYTTMEERHFLFDLSKLLALSDIRKALIPLAYQYNFLSTTYKKQVWTCCRLDPDGIHQWHLRFYHFNGIIKVTGHWEVDPLISPSQHLAGIDLRRLTLPEKKEIWNALQKSEKSPPIPA